MKKNLFKRAAALLGAVIVAATMFACSDSDTPDTPPTPPASEAPSVSLRAGSTAYEVLSFIITPKNAVECAYTYVKKGETVPSAEAVLDKGTAADAAKTSTQTINGLEKATEYIIVAAVKGADGSVAASEPLTMKTEGVGEVTYENIELHYLVDAVYTFSNSKQMGCYFVTFGNDRPSSQGLPAKDGDIQLTLDLYGALSANQNDAQLPVGEYRIGNQWDSMVWSPETSCVVTRMDGEAEFVAMVDGVVKVEKEGSIYTLTADMVTIDGQAVKTVSRGEIAFTASGSDDFDTFRTPQEVVYTYGNMRFYGNWSRPHADDMTLTFKADKLNEQNEPVGRYELTLSAYMEKQENPYDENIQLQEGVYNVSLKPSTSVTSIPMTIDPGEMGTGAIAEGYPLYSHLIYTDAVSGVRTIGFLKEGTMTVSRKDGQYSIAFNFKSSEGIALTGTFDAPLEIHNFCDNDTQPSKLPLRPWSTLEADYTVDFAEGTMAFAYYGGKDLMPTLDTWLVYIMPKADVKSDVMYFEMLVPPGLGSTSIPEGEFTMSTSLSAYTAFPGYYEYGSMTNILSWLLHTDIVDGELAITGEVPLDKGSFTITKEGDNYRFVFNLEDDNKHAIKGEVLCPAEIEDYSSGPKAALRLRR